MASLLTIPLELLVAVSSFLPTKDLGALRLTCKQVEKSLYEWFSQEFFTKKQFMLTFKSLQALIDISKHVSFSTKLSHVIIATNAYNDYPYRFRDSDAGERFIQGWEDQKALITLGAGREMLTEAFENLKNLQTVGVRDFGSNQRLRDGISWNSWGATTVHNETGIDLSYNTSWSSPSQIETSFVPLVFKNLIYALGKANKTPETVEVLLRRDALPGSAFDIPGFILPTVEPLLSNLKTLLLNVNVDSGKHHTHSNGTLLDLQPGRSLRRFLGYTPQLTHLRLNFQIHQYNNNIQFLDWLSLPSHSLRSQATDFFDPPPVDFPNLKTLDIGQVQARPKAILDVIAKFAPTLQDINLWKVALNDGLSNLPNDQKPNLWANFFRGLAKIPALQLHHLKAGMLKQDNIHVNFKIPDTDDAPVLKVKEYSGKKMNVFLKELEEEVFVSWPQPIQRSTDDDDDEEMADDDEDDEDAEDGEDNEDNDDDDDESYED